MSQKQVESATSADIQRVIVTGCNNSGIEDCLLTAQSVINVDDMCTPTREWKKMSCKSRTSSSSSNTKKESMDKLMESLEKKMEDQLGAIFNIVQNLSTSQTLTQKQNDTETFLS